MESILSSAQENVKHRPVKVGRKTTYIRWTLTNASKEFGVNQEIIAKRLKGQGILPGEDGYYSTKQIATAVYGDLERERIRLTSAEADAQERENLLELGKLIDATEFEKDYAPIYVEMVRLIRSSKLTEDEQDALLAKLSETHENHEK